MTRIDFYILADESIAARHAFACRLVQKTFKMGHSIYIHCDDEKQAHDLDRMLWTEETHSFIPHRIYSNEQQSKTENAIDIGWQSPPEYHHDLMINLGQDCPDFFSRFERLAEVVVQEENILQATRNNYRKFSNKNYPLHRHDMRR